MRAGAGRGVRDQLQRLGWIDGSNIGIDFRYATDDPARIRALALELLGLGPDLMVSNSNLVTTILQSEVRRIPLVFVSVSDPVGSGFVTDLARPTGNVTGFANFQPSMGSKWLEKLRGIAPQVERVGLMLHPEPPNIGYLNSAEVAAPSLKIKLVGLEVHGSNEIERALAGFAGQPGSGLVIAPNVVTFANSALIVSARHAWRARDLSVRPFVIKEGGLMSYGFDATDSFGKGRYMSTNYSEAQIPLICPCNIQRNSRLSSTSRTARALGLDSIRPMLLAEADEVISEGSSNDHNGVQVGVAQ